MVEIDVEDWSDVTSLTWQHGLRLGEDRAAGRQLRLLPCSRVAVHSHAQAVVGA